MEPIQSALANRYKIGGDLSLAHMAIISNTDMYETALEHGATKKEAAVLSLGSIAGMFSVDKFLGLGEMFLEKPEKAAANALRQSVSQESEGFVEGLKQLAKMPESPQKYVNIMKKGTDFGKIQLRNMQKTIKLELLELQEKLLEKAWKKLQKNQ